MNQVINEYLVIESLKKINLDNLVIQIPKGANKLVVNKTKLDSYFYSYVFQSDKKMLDLNYIKKPQYDHLIRYCNSCLEFIIHPLKHINEDS